jgi:hypothetical protein
MKTASRSAGPPSTESAPVADGRTIEGVRIENPFAALPA